MKILSSIYQELINNCSFKVELGGILGLTSDIITHYQFDEPTDISEYYYHPNTENLNTIISKWQNEGIVFTGIFHSHPTGITNLSFDDEKYINNIMHSVPLSTLYFPIVSPGKEIYFHRAELKNNMVIIYDEPITIVYDLL